MDFSAEGLAGIGGEPVAVVERVRVNDERFVGIEDAEVGIFSGGDGAFLREAGEVRGEGAEPVGQLLERAAALVGFGPGDGEEELQRGDSAPGFGEVAGVELFEGGRAGGVVGGDHVNEVGLERGPERFARGGFADRRCAFELRGAVGDFFRGEVQVVGTGFNGDRDAGVARGGDGGKRFAARKMHDVRGAVAFFRESQEQVNRGGFPVIRPRCEIAGVAAGIVVGETLGRHVVDFSVREERDTARGEEGHHGSEIRFSRCGEVIDAGVDEERFDRNDTGVEKCGDFVGISVDQATVEADIDMSAGSDEGGLFLSKGSERRGDRRGVEGHVDKRGDAAGCGGFGGGVETFPPDARSVGSVVGVVDVDVGIHEAGENGEIAEVDDGSVWNGLIAGKEGLDFFALDENGGGCASVRCDDAH